MMGKQRIGSVVTQGVSSCIDKRLDYRSTNLVQKNFLFRIDREASCCFYLIICMIVNILHNRVRKLQMKYFLSKRSTMY